jgi:hypothetical protein
MTAITSILPPCLLPLTFSSLPVELPPCLCTGCLFGCLYYLKMAFLLLLLLRSILSLPFQERQYGARSSRGRLSGGPLEMVFLPHTCSHHAHYQRTELILWGSFFSRRLQHQLQFVGLSRETVVLVVRQKTGNLVVANASERTGQHVVDFTFQHEQANQEAFQ